MLIYLHVHLSHSTSRVYTWYVNTYKCCQWKWKWKWIAGPAKTTLLPVNEQGERGTELAWTISLCDSICRQPDATEIRLLVCVLVLAFLQTLTFWGEVIYFVSFSILLNFSILTARCPGRIDRWLNETCVASAPMVVILMFLRYCYLIYCELFRCLQILLKGCLSPSWCWTYSAIIWCSIFCKGSVLLGPWRSRHYSWAILRAMTKKISPRVWLMKPWRSASLMKQTMSMNKLDDKYISWWKNRKLATTLQCMAKMTTCINTRL